MDFATYQHEAERTLARRPLVDYSEDEMKLKLAVMGLGIAGESGEVADLIKKYIGHGHPLDKNLIAKELGDVLWYIAALATLNGLSLSDVAITNVAKLRLRYPEGFSEEASRNRKDG
jgi:NTP pyrophosphatase (non-canonical NTP hydrolase)